MLLIKEKKILLTLWSSSPTKLWYSFLGIMKAARFAVYNAKNTTANRAQILDINLEEDKNKHIECIMNMNTYE